MDTLALTDRDGTYGAVKFAKACLRAGIRPVLGVDLAYRRRAPPGGDPRRPAYAACPDPGARRRLPRPAAAAGHLPGQRAGPGWAAICRLVSATHLAGERGHPVATLDLVAEHAAGGDVLVLLGPASELGAAATRAPRRPRPGGARTAGASWCRAENLLVEVVSHRLPGHGAGVRPARRPDGRGGPRRPGSASVLTNAVRYADRADAPTVDVLDAARRLVPLDLRHVDRGNAEGFLKSGKEMHEVAEEICRLAGLAATATPGDLLARTRAVADRCALDPRADLGPGRGALPRARARDQPGREAPAESADAAAPGPLRGRDRATATARAPRQRIWKRLDDELRADRRARLRLLLPHRRRRHRPDPRDGHAVRGPGVGRRQPGQLPARRLRGRPAPPRPAHGAVPLAAAPGPARHRHRRRVRPPARGLRARSSTATAASGACASR